VFGERARCRPARPTGKPTDGRDSMARANEMSGSRGSAGRGAWKRGPAIQQRLRRRRGRGCPRRGGREKHTVTAGMQSPSRQARCARDNVQRGADWMGMEGMWVSWRNCREREAIWSRGFLLFLMPPVMENFEEDPGPGPENDYLWKRTPVRRACRAPPMMRRCLSCRSRPDFGESQTIKEKSA